MRAGPGRFSGDDVKKPTSRKPIARPSAKGRVGKARPGSGGTSSADPLDPAFAKVAAAFAKDAAVGLGKMFSSKAVLNVNGKIFAMLVKGKFVAKLPKDRVAALVSSGAGELFDPGHGRLMKEWIALGDEGPPWVDLARDAYAFVKSGGR